LISSGEHIYFDDPLTGHPDVRTRLESTEYFFFGNGFFQGAVQYCISGEGSPFGLLIMDPDNLTMKRNALTMDLAEGLSGTSLLISENNLTGRFDNHGTVGWKPDPEHPEIEINWEWRGLKITELIYCPDNKKPLFIRQINFRNILSEERTIYFETSVPGRTLKESFLIKSKGKESFYISYSLMEGGIVNPELINKPGSGNPGIFRNDMTRIKTDHNLLEKFFSASAFQLASMISANGKMDASIWQYNREWVRDHSFMCLGLIYSGNIVQAKIFLGRLISDFVSEEGDTIDSSEKRNFDEVELDQNGELLYTINEYLKWTGDKDFVIKFRQKIISIAEYPLKTEFLDKESGLLHNSREYWERHSIHGITDGYEFAYQMWVIKGLRAASSMGRDCSFGDPEKWSEKANKIFNSLFDEKKSGLVFNGKIIKRLSPDGSIQTKSIRNMETGCPKESLCREMEIIY
jgi:hypothetical protein